MTEDRFGIAPPVECRAATRKQPVGTRRAGLSSVRGDWPWPWNYRVRLLSTGHRSSLGEQQW